MGRRRADNIYWKVIWWIKELRQFICIDGSKVMIKPFGKESFEDIYFRVQTISKMLDDIKQEMLDEWSEENAK